MSDFLKNMESNIADYYKLSDDILSDASAIIDAAQSSAYRAVNIALLQRNWLLGKRIAQEELTGDRQKDYGLEVIKRLSKELNQKYGKGFTKSSLYAFYNFYKEYPDIFQTAFGKSLGILSWSHYLVLMRVYDIEARNWYEQEALKETIKNPMVVEFLGLSSDVSLRESKLEASIISNLQKFLMELGKGYAFVARQQHIHTEKEDYFIDLVFYNYILKYFVLIDLKTTKITHQDVGQMDMYIRMYDELKRGEGDNPTLGIVLCAETDEDIAKYSILHGNEQLFASKYKLYLPTEEQLRAEIEAQKAIFKLQQEERLIF